MKAPIRKVAPSVDAPGTLDDKFRKLYPNLHTGLFAVRDELGKSRETHTLFFCIDDGDWKGLLKDRENDCQAWFTAETFTDLLGAFERAVATGEADWRDAPPSPKRKSPRKGT